MSLKSYAGRHFAVVATLFVLALVTDVSAQTYLKGQHIEPAFEGWRQLENGNYMMIFGYHNENWEEELDIPIGENNFFSPGMEDRGQPTHFLPRRNRFTFEVEVPEDWGDRELTWTITANGVTKVAYGSLARVFEVDHVVIAYEAVSLGACTINTEWLTNMMHLTVTA